MSANTDKLLLTPEGRADLRAMHTCVQRMSSRSCIACNSGVPYPHPSIDEIIDGLKPRPTGSVSGREPCLSKTNARPDASTPGHEIRWACPKCGYDASEPVTTRMLILIKRDPPSLNRRLVNTLVGGRLYRQEKSAWMLEVRAARLEHKIPYAYRDAGDRSSWPVVVGGKRRVTLERSYSGRKKERDIDNLIGGMKPVVDAMVAERILLDDSPAHAEIHYKQRRTDKPDDDGLWIELEILETR